MREARCDVSSRAHQIGTKLALFRFFFFLKNLTARSSFLFEKVTPALPKHLQARAFYTGLLVATCFGFAAHCGRPQQSKKMYTAIKRIWDRNRADLRIMRSMGTDHYKKGIVKMAYMKKTYLTSYEEALGLGDEQMKALKARVKAGKGRASAASYRQRMGKI